MKPGEMVRCGCGAQGFHEVLNYKLREGSVSGSLHYDPVTTLACEVCRKRWTVKELLGVPCNTLGGD